MEKYTYETPKGTRIGHVHLKVSNLQKSLDFYEVILGFNVMARMGDRSAFISAGGYHHHIALTTRFSKDGNRPPENSTGLFHTAIAYPKRKDLAKILKRLVKFNVELTGAADHGFSEALYLDDPDRNGVELYWDKPKELWPIKDDGTMDMFSKNLDLKALLMEADD
jgi:catechol 2,3-dioxygenase